MTTTLSEMDSVNRTHLLAWLGAFAGWIFDFYEIALLSFLVVPISQEFHLSALQTGRILSIQLLAIAVGGVVFGYLGDRLGRQRLLKWTIVIYGVFTLARAFTPDYPVLMLFTFLAGIGLGGEYGLGQALVTEVMPTRRRGWWSGMLYSGTAIGLSLAALAGGYLLPAVGWRWVFGISCLPIILAVVIRYMSPESDVWEQRSRQRTATDWSLLARRVFLVPLILCTVAGALEFFAYYGISQFLPTYLIEQEGFSFSGTAWWILIIAAASFVGITLGSYASDRWGRRGAWGALSVTAALGGLILGLAWGSSLKSGWILVPYFVLFMGSGVASLFGTVFAEQFPTETRAVGVSVALQVGRGLSYFPPLIAAAVYPVYGYKPLILGGAALFAILAVTPWAFRFTDGRGRTIAEVDGQDAAAAGVHDMAGPVGNQAV